jgi:hypothetical protein
MKHGLAWVLIAAFVIAGMPASAQEPLAATGRSANFTEEGPIARAARRESLKIPLDIGAVQESPAVTAVRERARRLSPGDKVTVTMRSGEKVRGTLVAVSDSSIVLLRSKDAGYNAFGEKIRAAAPPAKVEMSYEQVRSIRKPISGGAVAAIVVAGLVAFYVVTRAATGWND